MSRKSLEKHDCEYLGLIEIATLNPRQFRFVGESDPSIVEPLIGSLRERIARLGITSRHWLLDAELALREALANAIYHGNLEIDSAIYRNDPAAFFELARRRQKQSRFFRRLVELTTTVTDEAVEFSVRDEGPGFDISAVSDPCDRENIAKPCGRGLLLMHSAMDQVTFLGRGNVVTMRKRVQPLEDVA